MKLLNKKPILIAEAGVNHNGKLNLVKKLIDIAIDAGADFVKFQIFKANKLCLPNTKKANYQIRNTNKKESQLQMLKKYELNYAKHKLIIKICKKKKIGYLASVFDLDSLNFLVKNKIKIVKIPSGEITNHYLIKQIARKIETIIISTGASNILDVTKAINILLKNGVKKNNIILLHCNSEYPSTNYNDLNLNVLKTYKKKFRIRVGYSDHTNNQIASIVSIGLGAEVFEKHFTIDNNLDGPDHTASLNKDDFKNYCSAIKNAYLSLGKFKKIVSNSEKKNQKIIRKSIYAIKNIKKGESFTLKNIYCLRPVRKRSSINFEKLLGKKAKKNYFSFEEINER